MSMLFNYNITVLFAILVIAGNFVLFFFFSFGNNFSFSNKCNVGRQFDRNHDENGNCNNSKIMIIAMIITICYFHEITTNYCHHFILLVQSLFIITTDIMITIMFMIMIVITLLLMVLFILFYYY